MQIIVQKHFFSRVAALYSVYPDKSTVSFQSYEYDAQNRIIAVNSHDITWPTSDDVIRDEYVYNTNGNRACRIHYYNGIRGEIELYGSYDNKVSFLRTNKVWQFLMQDYSVNNRIGATTYNSYNLPTKLLPTVAGHCHCQTHCIKKPRSVPGLFYLSSFIS